MSLKSVRSHNFIRSSKLSDSQPNEVTKLSIRFFDFENLKCCLETEIEIVAMFFKSQMKKSELKHFNDEAELTLSIELNCEDQEEVFSLFAYPVPLTLSKLEPSAILGVTNIDLYPLCSNQIENRVFRILFERVSDQTTLLLRKISCSVEISSDHPILNEPIENSLYITINSICNLDEKENSQLSFGIMVPVGEQLNKSVIVDNITDTFEPCHQGAIKKRWWNLLDIKGKGSESPFHVKSYKYTLKTHEKKLLSDLGNDRIINAIGRVILLSDTNKLFRNHLKKSLKVAMEVMIDGNHLMGFFDPSDLLHVERKTVRAVVPLLYFNNLSLLQNCNHSSAFTTSTSTKSSVRKSKKEAVKKKSTKTSSVSSLVHQSFETEKVSEVPYLNKCGQQVFIIVDLELEKTLNPEVFEDSHEDLWGTSSPGKPIQSDAENSDKFSNFKKQLLLVSRNILKTYNKEPDVDKIVMSMISDGQYEVIENHLIAEMDPIAPTYVCSFDEVKDDIVCQLSSKVLNSGFENDKNHQTFLAKVYEALGMEERSDRIFLQYIRENSCEDTFINYGVHNLRKEKFSKALACIEKAMTYNEISITGHIMKAYISFKLQKYSESESLMSFIKSKHCNSMELSMVEHLVGIKKSMTSSDYYHKAHNFTSKYFKTQELQQVYESPEALWFANEDHDELLSWSDPFIRSAILFIKLGCYDFAELALCEYYTTHGPNLNHSYLLAVIDAMKGDSRSSLIHLNKISIEDCENQELNYEKIVVLMSLMLIKSEKYERAESLLKNHVLLGNQTLEYFLLHVMLGTHCNVSGDYEEAKSHLIQANRIFPAELTFVELGKCYQNVNKLSTAEQCFHQSITCGFDSRDAWSRLCQIYQKQNRETLVKLCMKHLYSNSI